MSETTKTATTTKTVTPFSLEERDQYGLEDASFKLFHRLREDIDRGIKVEFNFNPEATDLVVYDGEIGNKNLIVGIAMGEWNEATGGGYHQDEPEVQEMTRAINIIHDAFT